VDVYQLSGKYRYDVAVDAYYEPLFVFSISPPLTLSLSGMPQYFGYYSL